MMNLRRFQIPPRRIAAGLAACALLSAPAFASATTTAPDQHEAVEAVQDVQSALADLRADGEPLIRAVPSSALVRDAADGDLSIGGVSMNIPVNEESPPIRVGASVVMDGDVDGTALVAHRALGLEKESARLARLGSWVETSWRKNPWGTDWLLPDENLQDVVIYLNKPETERLVYWVGKGVGAASGLTTFLKLGGAPGAIAGVLAGLILDRVSEGFVSRVGWSDPSNCAVISFNWSKVPPAAFPNWPPLDKWMCR